MSVPVGGPDLTQRGDESRTTVNAGINFLVTQKVGNILDCLREYLLSGGSLQRPCLSTINYTSFSDGAECAVRKNV